MRLAEEEKPGAVHLELPEDIAAEQTDSMPIPPSLTRRPLAECKSIAAAVSKLKAAKSPILVIGAGANRKMTAKVLRQLIDKTGIPFVTTQMGKGVVDERHPRFLGNAALSSGDFVHRAVKSADLIINIGHDVIEKPPFFMVRGGTEVVHINFRSAEVDPVYFPQIEVVGDIANAVWQIAESLETQEHWDFSRLLTIRSANEAQVIEGAGLRSAMAARLVYPHKPIVAVCGDGGFMMNSQELETAVRMKMKMNLIVIILRDDGYGMIRWKQSQMGFQDFGLDYGNPDFACMPTAMALKGTGLKAQKLSCR
jgi:acetolactate synthase-1/2/3 large subunit